MNMVNIILINKSINLINVMNTVNTTNKNNNYSIQFAITKIKFKFQICLFSAKLIPETHLEM